MSGFGLTRPLSLHTRYASFAAMRVIVSSSEVHAISGLFLGHHFSLAASRPYCVTRHVCQFIREFGSLLSCCSGEYQYSSDLRRRSRSRSAKSRAGVLNEGGALGGVDCGAPAGVLNERGALGGS